MTGALPQAGVGVGLLIVSGILVMLGGILVMLGAMAGPTLAARWKTRRFWQRMTRRRRR